jgi:hypothetical protein
VRDLGTAESAELRRSRQNIFAGQTIHTLRAAGGSFKIAAKKVSAAG